MAPRPGNFPAAFTSPRADPGLVPGAPGASGVPQPERTRASASYPGVRDALPICSGQYRVCSMRKTSRTRARPGDKRIDEFTTNEYPIRPEGGVSGNVSHSSRKPDSTTERFTLSSHPADVTPVDCMSEAGSVTVVARSKGLSLRHRLPEQREDITFDP